MNNVLDRLSQHSDQELIDASIRNDSRAQRALYERYVSKMYAVCLRYSGCTDDAKDLLQEGFITAFSNMASFSGAGSFEGWLRKIFVNTSLMKIRKRDLLKDSSDITDYCSECRISENALNSLYGKDLVRLISSMPVGFRTIFNLYVIEGYSHQEIAQMLGINEGTSRSQLNRAKAWLKERIYKLNMR